MSRLQLIALPLALLAIGACSRLPDRIETVERARASISEVQREPLAGRAAPRELAAAQDALAAADTAYEDREPLELIEHHAYVAQRYADISREMVAEARAREEVEQGEAERNRIIAEAREREAAVAQRAAEQAAREAEIQSAAAREQGLAAAAAEERNRELQRELEELQAKETDRGMVLTLGDVLFDTGQATLKAGAATAVDRLAQFMRDYPERSVRIEGHTDSAGSEDANQGLSERRAQAVREALVERGLEASRIGAVGYGEARPIVGNETAAGRQQNRRVEIVVSDAQGAFAEDSKRQLL